MATGVVTAPIGVEWTFPIEMLTMESLVLGTGSWGEVKAAKLHGISVAAKTLHFSKPGGGLSSGDQAIVVESLMKECVFLHKLRHPNIVTFMGVATDGDRQPLVLVTERLERSLDHALHDDAVRLKVEQEAPVLRGIGRALTYLHSQNFIHRDIKSTNVLLDAHGIAKLCDLGEGFALSAQRGARTVVGTPYYMAPEMKTDAAKSFAVDVYSFGVVIAEVSSRMRPTPGAEMKLLDTGTYVPVPSVERYAKLLEAMPNPDFRRIATKCLADAPGLRPTAAALLDELEGPNALDAVRELRLELAQLRRELQSEREKAARNALPCDGGFAFTYTLTDVTAKRAASVNEYLPPFIALGYALQLYVCYNGRGEATNTHLSLSVCMAPGPDDTELSWPFHNCYRITLLHPNDRARDCSIDMNPRTGPRPEGWLRPVSGILHIGEGRAQFIAHAAMADFLTNDAMRVRVTVLDDRITQLDDRMAQVEPQTRLAFPCDGGAAYVYTLTNVAAKRAVSVVEDLPPFIALGYALQPRVLYDGDGRGEGTHLSLFLYVVCGPNDAALQWPFRHRYRMAVLHQSDRSRDVVASVDPRVEGEPEEWARPATRDKTGGYGEDQLLAHDAAVGFITGDSMLVMITVLKEVERMAFPCSDGFAFVYTLTDVAAKRTSSSMECLPPFIVLGYALQLQAQYNWDDTHLSLVVDIARGPNDAALQWPFRHRYRLVVLHPSDRSRDVVAFVDPRDGEADEWARPVGKERNDCGEYLELAHDEAAEFITEDTMHVMITVLDDDARSSGTA